MAKHPIVNVERRGPVWRRDFNDLVRDESGKCSPSKMGAISGQIIAANYLIVHWEQAIDNWDILAILFTVLIAPELAKKLLTMKYGGTDDKVTTTATAAVTTTTKGTKQ